VLVKSVGRWSVMANVRRRHSKPLAESFPEV
jgi:hypothetical protein